MELGGRAAEGGEGAPPGNGGRGADVELLVLLGQGHGGDLTAERVRACLALELLYIRLVRSFARTSWQFQIGVLSNLKKAAGCLQLLIGFLY